MRIALTDPIAAAGETVLYAAEHEILPGSGGDLRRLLARADAVVVRRKLPNDVMVLAQLLAVTQQVRAMHADLLAAG